MLRGIKDRFVGNFRTNIVIQLYRIAKQEYKNDLRVPQFYKNHIQNVIFKISIEIIILIYTFPFPIAKNQFYQR